MAPALAAGEELLYRLPWPDGHTYTFLHAAGANPHFQTRDLHAVDISMAEGTPVVAARAGVVEAVEEGHPRGRDAEPATFEGNLVRVRHEDGTIATYAHLRAARVRTGERVFTGQLLGDSGASGEVTNPQLHFGLSRQVRNAAGRWEEVSLPVEFTVGEPPFSFEPRAGMIATATYHRPAVRPYFATDMRHVHEPPRVLTVEEEQDAWLHLCGVMAGGLAMVVLTTWLSLRTWGH